MQNGLYEKIRDLGHVNNFEDWEEEQRESETGQRLQKLLNTLQSYIASDLFKVVLDELFRVDKSGVDLKAPNENEKKHSAAPPRRRNSLPESKMNEKTDKMCYLLKCTSISLIFS